MSAKLIHAIYTINTQASSALYRQIMEQTKQAIRSGLLKTGQQLPSVRLMASHLQVNPMTISKAFSQLELQGVLERRKGIGMLVSQHHKVDALDHDLAFQLARFISLAKSEHFDDDAIIALVQHTLNAN